MEEGPVRSQVEDGQALLTIDRPAARNALSPEVVAGAPGRAGPRRGGPGRRAWWCSPAAGDRVFSAGGDLGAMRRGRLPRGPRGSAAPTARCSRRWPARPCRPWRGSTGTRSAAGWGWCSPATSRWRWTRPSWGRPEIDVGLFPMMVLALAAAARGPQARAGAGPHRRPAEGRGGAALGAPEPGGAPRRAGRRDARARRPGWRGRARPSSRSGSRAFRTAEDLRCRGDGVPRRAALAQPAGTEDAAEGISAFLESAGRPRWKDR